MTEKETLVQLALGTFNINDLCYLVEISENPRVLTAAAKMFSNIELDKDNISGNGTDTILNKFMNNPHTPKLVKEYVCHIIQAD